MYAASQINTLWLKGLNHGNDYTVHPLNEYIIPERGKTIVVRSPESPDEINEIHKTAGILETGLSLSGGAIVSREVGGKTWRQRVQVGSRGLGSCNK